MPSVDLSELQSVNDAALAKLTEALATLKIMRTQLMPPEDLNRLNAKISAIVSEQHHRETIGAHLAAASVMVGPLSAGDEAELRQLAEGIDKAIIDDATVNLAISTASEVLTMVKEMGNIVDDVPVKT